MEKMRDEGNIKEILGGDGISWLNMIQIERWTREWNSKEGKSRKMTKFEEIIEKRLKLEEKTERKGTVNQIYKLLIEAEQDTQGLKTQWQYDLDKEVKGEEWDKMWDQRIMKNM